MPQFNVSKEVYNGPCHEYPGFERTVTLRNGTEITVEICWEFNDEIYWTFRKEYATNLEALDSLGFYVYLLRKSAPLPAGRDFQESPPPELYQRIEADCAARSVFLPDDGAGYEYPGPPVSFVD
jgi:hypothetical protein